MGGGRTAEGAKIYRRVDGTYIRVVPYKRINYKNVENLIVDSWNGFGSEKLILDSLGLGNKMSFKGKVSPTTDGLLTIGMAKMAAKYGNDVITDVRYGDPDGFGYWELAHTNVDEDSSYISLNPSQYKQSNDKDRNDNHELGVRNGFHPEGNDDEFTIMHEFAHALQRKLVQKSKFSFDDEYAKYHNRDINRYEQLMNSLDQRSLKEYHEGYRKEIAEIKKRNPNIERDALIHKQLFQLMESEYQDKTEALMNRQNFQIMMLFQKAGAISPSDVGMKLTGNKESYASKDWSEAHAECVADVMYNGDNARPISKAYVKEMDKLLGVRS